MLKIPIIYELKTVCAQFAHALQKLQLSCEIPKGGGFLKYKCNDVLLQKCDLFVYEGV